MTQTTKGRIRIYACGGAALNIAQTLEHFSKKEEVGIARVELAYVDTSRANLSDKHPDASIYLLPNKDGSGKIRRENAAEIIAHTPDVLQKFPPADLNIIISSGSGGTGSVFAPSLASELLARNLPVIVFMIGSAEARQEVNNTLDTIKSYENIAKNARKVPLVMSYFQNSAETPRSVVDQSVIEELNMLAVLFSRENKELDSQDLYNWLRFDRVTSYQPQLAALKTFVGTVPKDVPHVATVATLSLPGHDVVLDFIPDYKTSGYLPAGTISDRLKESMPAFFLVTTDAPGQVAHALNKSLDALNQAQRARVPGQQILSGSETATDNGLIV